MSIDKTGPSTTNCHPNDTSSFNYNEGDVDLDGQTQVQQERIEREIIDNQPLVSEKLSTDKLRNEYDVEDSVYQSKIRELTKKYKYIRKTRGDGNCFYRAFGFGYLEQNLKNELELDRFRRLVADLKDKLVQLGYQEFTVEDVRDVVIDTIDGVCQGGDEASLMKIFCSQQHSDYFVAYLRLFTSAYLQMNADFFQNFLEGPSKTVKEFCCTDVEPMARESDNIHIIALTKAAQVSLRVIYMDRSETSQLTTHDFSHNDNEQAFQPMITFLYRPGHYDLLYEN